MDDPHADVRTAPFWDATREERLVCARCATCGTFRMPPAAFCHACRNQEIEWVQLAGTGHVYTFTVVRHPLRPEFADVVPFVIAVLSLDGAGDARLISNVVECDPETVTVGMPVRVVWDHVSDTLTYPRFAPATDDVQAASVALIP
jgi:uncharacterized OB-fold protein